MIPARGFRRPLRVLALALACAAPAAGQEAAAPGGDYVVMVSFDGFRHDYIDRGVTPTFARLAAEGARARGLVPVFPSKTFPNHHSIATGLRPRRHGIIGNEFDDPVLGAFVSDSPDAGRFFGGEPIWSTAERQGLRTASYFWFGADKVIDGRRPTYWKRWDGTVLPEARIDTVLAWLAKPEPERPRLTLLYFELLDNAGHRNGPVSPWLDSTLAQADGILARLVRGLEASPVAGRVHLILVSDHGMTPVDPARTVALDTIIDLAGVHTVAYGPYTTLDFRGDTLRRAAALATLDARLRHARAYPRDRIPASWHWRDSPRIPDVLIVAEDQWSVGRAEQVARIRAGMGNHGYDPASPAMHGLFLAWGPRIRPGVRIEAFENIHIHPFLAALLGIEPAADIDGEAAVLAEVLR